MRLLYIFLLFIAGNITTVNAYLFRINAQDSVTSWDVCDGSQCSQSPTIIYDSSTNNFTRKITFHKDNKRVFWKENFTCKVMFEFNCPSNKARQVYDFYIYLKKHNKKGHNYTCPNNDQYIGNIDHSYYYINVCIKKYCEGVSH